MTSLFFLVATSGIIYLTIHFLLFVEDGISLDSEKSELVVSIKENKYLDLSGTIEEREKKRGEVISPFNQEENQTSLKKDPFNLP